MHYVSAEIQDRLLATLLFAPQRAGRFLSAQPAWTAPDWSRLVEKARQEGVSAVLYHNITSHRLDGLVPQAPVAAFCDEYHANLKRNLSVIGTLREVLAAFEQDGIPCIVLKGIVLAECVYPNIALRGMSDIDILIKKADLLRADDLLSSLGYTPRDSTAEKAIQNPAGYLASLDYRKSAPSALGLHVHWHPVNTSVPATMFASQVDLNRLWDRAMVAGVADRRVLTLCPEHLIIYLCEHALRVGHSFDRLILVCDIFYAVRAFERNLDWDFLAGESRRFNLSRFVYHGLSIVRHHTSLDIPESCLAGLKPQDLSAGERYFLKCQFGNRRFRGGAYFIYLAMNRSLPAKIRFIARTFFPPAPILLQRQYRTGPEGSKSLYLRRMREIVSHIFEGMAPGRPAEPGSP